VRSYTPPRPFTLSGDVYERILRFARSEGLPLGLVVVQRQNRLSDSARRVLAALEEQVVSRSQESEWPGTRLVDHAAKVIRFQLNDETVDILVEAADSFFDWEQPELPEDLALLREDGTTWLGSITHERELWFELTADEKRRLLAAVPEVGATR